VLKTAEEGVAVSSVVEMHIRSARLRNIRGSIDKQRVASLVRAGALGEGLRVANRPIVTPGSD